MTLLILNYFTSFNNVTYYTDQICIKANLAYQCRIWSGKLLSKAMTDALQVLQTLQHVQLQRRYLIQTHTHPRTYTRLQ